MLMQLSTWPELERRLDVSRAVLIPIGSHEQHGPTGLLGTDFLCPEIIAHRVHVSADILVTPTFNVGMAQHHLGFPGTISLRPSTMIAAISDWVSSLASQGFQYFYFLNGHGGNAATIEAAFCEIFAEDSFSGRGRGLALLCRNWWDLPGVRSLCEDMFPIGHGVHATPSEISVTNFHFPDTVRTAELAPPIAPSGPIRNSQDFRVRFADGRVGSDPSQASVDCGATIVEAAVLGLGEDFRAFAQDAGASLARRLPTRCHP